MNQRKDISVMTDICEAHCNDLGPRGFCGEQAKALSNAGFGNIEEAINDYTSELKRELRSGLYGVIGEKESEKVQEIVDNFLVEFKKWFQ